MLASELDLESLRQETAPPQPGLSQLEEHILSPALVACGGGRGMKIKYVHERVEVRPSVPSYLPSFLVEGGLKVGYSCCCFMLHEAMLYTHTPKPFPTVGTSIWT